jgi:hypothetical protein
MQNNAKTNNKKIVSIKFIGILMLLIVPLGIMLWFHNCPEPEKPMDPDTNILLPIDSSFGYNSQIASHNNILISLLKAREATNTSCNVSHEESRRQIRNIYFGILALVLSQLIRKNRKSALAIYSITLVYTILVYGLDIHLEDMSNREIISNVISSNALEFLINSKSTERIEYIINPKPMKEQYKKAGETCSRWYRKLWLASRLDPERILYYIFPWITIYIFMLITYLNRQTSNTNCLTSDR